MSFLLNLTEKKTFFRLIVRQKEYNQSTFIFSDNLFIETYRIHLFIITIQINFGLLFFDLCKLFLLIIDIGSFCNRI